MRLPALNTLRTTLLACLVLVGLQLLLAVAPQATDHRIVCEEIALNSDVAQDDGSGLDLDADLPLSSFGTVCSSASQLQGSAAAFSDKDADRSGLTVLPVSGLQPSAP